MTTPTKKKNNNKKKNFFERAASGVNSLLLDSSIRSRASRELSNVKNNIYSRGNKFVHSLPIKIPSSLSFSRTSTSTVGFNEKDDGSTCDLQVGEGKPYLDSPAFLRTQLWESAMKKYYVNTTSTANTYERLLSQRREEQEQEQEQEEEEVKTDKDNCDKEEEDSKSLIERDLRRTFPHHPSFKSAKGINKMRRLLLAYSEYDRSVGYCQGMPFIVGILALYMNESDAFQALLFILQKPRHAREIYGEDGVGLKRTFAKLDGLLRRENERLFAHLHNFKVDSMMYASGWILTCFASDFTSRFSCRVMDVIVANANVDFTYADFITNVAVSILNEATEELLAIGRDENDEKELIFEELLHYIRYEPQRWDGERLNRVVTIAVHSLSERSKICKELDCAMDAAGGTSV